METHDRKKHPEPQSSLIEEPDFVELCRIAKRLSAERQDQLSDLLLTEHCNRMAADLDAALRIYNDEEQPFDVS